MVTITTSQFDDFLQSFEELLQDIFKLESFFVLVTGDFNCINSNWYLGDPVTPHGAHGETLTSFSIFNISNMFWPSFYYPPHLVMESGVHSFLSSKCHHEIVFLFLNRKNEYPPLYAFILRGYSRAARLH